MDRIQPLPPQRQRKEGSEATHELSRVDGAETGAGAIRGPGLGSVFPQPGHSSKGNPKCAS